VDTVRVGAPVEYERDVLLEFTVPRVALPVFTVLRVLLLVPYEEFRVVVAVRLLDTVEVVLPVLVTASFV
jgi:hypothetical protein